MTITANGILRLHGGMLMLVTVCFTIVAYAGVLFAVGPYRALADTPMVAGGLAQAYPLMGLLGLCLWKAPLTNRSRFFSKIGIAAHCAPVATYIALWAPLMDSPLSKAAPLGLTIHALGIGLELVALNVGHGGDRWG